MCAAALRPSATVAHVQIACGTRNCVLRAMIHAIEFSLSCMRRFGVLLLSSPVALQVVELKNSALNLHLPDK